MLVAIPPPLLSVLRVLVLVGALARMMLLMIRLRRRHLQPTSAKRAKGRPGDRANARTESSEQ